MPRFGNTIAGLQELTSAMDATISKATELSQVAPAVQQAVEEVHKSADVLGDLLEKSKAEQNDWSDEVNFTIELLRIGGASLDKFKAQFGDAMIQTEEGNKRISEILAGADFDQYRIKLQELMQQILDGGTELGEVISFLEENAGTVAKGLINILNLFKQGKASLEDVQRALDAAREAFGAGTEFGGLADAIENALLGGQI